MKSPLVLAVLLFTETSAFLHNAPPRCFFTRLNANKGPGNVRRPQNEFSRTYRTESVLGGGPRQRDYQLSIDAKDEEREALSKRFELSQISKLQADLCLRREPNIKGGSNRVTGVEVEGSVIARVTQTCVRTNEDFEVDLEFPVYAVVRPIASLSDPDENDLAELQDFFEGEKKKKKKAVAGRNMNEMDVAELQRLLQDFDLEDDVIEDEAIYSMDGVIDCGELVSQLFWLKLDPYPKKPGTYPIRTSITG